LTPILTPTDPQFDPHGDVKQTYAIDGSTVKCMFFNTLCESM
jgi:hypothetical protein